MAFDSKKQREIMGQFATGVTVVGIAVGDGTWGMTANAVTSLSLDPPLVLVAVEQSSQTHAHLKASQGYSLSILSSAQREISDRFAFVGPKDFTGLNVTTAVTGAPILAECLGWVDCRITDVLRGGDHDIFIGEIVAGEIGEGEPLLYYGGRYARLAES